MHQLIERKQAEIRKVHPGLSCFSEGVYRIDIKDIPGISKASMIVVNLSDPHIEYTADLRTPSIIIILLSDALAQPVLCNCHIRTNIRAL